MIRQGTDSISRGDMYEGIMNRKTILSYIPLEISALERSPAMSKRIESWSPTLGREVQVLEPSGRFACGHNHYGGNMNVD